MHTYISPFVCPTCSYIVPARAHRHIITGCFGMARETGGNITGWEICSMSLAFPLV